MYPDSSSYKPWSSYSPRFSCFFWEKWQSTTLLVLGYAPDKRVRELLLSL
jgi:hypothetical protein